MFSVELTSEQIKARQGWIVIWQARDKISRVTFETKEPKATKAETIMKSFPLERHGGKFFGKGFGDRGARIEFRILGTLTRITPID